MRRKCPREGTRLKFDANPASAALYSPPIPQQGEVGTVVSIPLPGAGRKTCTGGHNQDLVYVNWPSVGVMGVARADVTKSSGKGPRSLQVNGLDLAGTAPIPKGDGPWVIIDKMTGGVVTVINTRDEFKTYPGSSYRKASERYEILSNEQYEKRRRGESARGVKPSPSVLRERIAHALNWPVEQTYQFSFQSLRELVRPVDPALAEEMSEEIRSQRYFRQVDGLGESAYKLSVDQRVNTPLGPGRITMVRGIHAGVQLDDGKFAHFTVSNVTPTGEKQRYISGLGFTPEKHAQQTHVFASEAMRALRESKEAVRAGDCPTALKMLLYGVGDVGAFNSNREAAAGQGVGDSIASGIEVTKDYHSAVRQFTAKCLKK